MFYSFFVVFLLFTLTIQYSIDPSVNPCHSNQLEDPYKVLYPVEQNGFGMCDPVTKEFSIKYCPTPMVFDVDLISCKTDPYNFDWENQDEHHQRANRNLRARILCTRKRRMSQGLSLRRRNHTEHEHFFGRGRPHIIRHHGPPKRLMGQNRQRPFFIVPHQRRPATVNATTPVNSAPSDHAEESEDGKGTDSKNVVQPGQGEDKSNRRKRSVLTDQENTFYDPFVDQHHEGELLERIRRADKVRMAEEEEERDLIATIIIVQHFGYSVA